MFWDKQSLVKITVKQQSRIYTHMGLVVITIFLMMVVGYCCGNTFCKDELNDCGNKYKDDINGGDDNDDDADDGDDGVDGVMVVVVVMTVTAIILMMVIIIMIIKPTGVSMVHYDPVSVFYPHPL